MNDDKKFRVIYISALNDDSDELCRTLKAQYYKNNVKNLGEWGGSMVVAEQSHMLNMKMIYAESVKEKPIDRFYNFHGNRRITHLEIFGNGICFCL